MDNQNMNHEPGKTCNCPHHKMIPLLVVLAGVDLLLGALNVLSPMAVNVILPILIIVAGATKMSGGMCKCCQAK